MNAGSHDRDADSGEEARFAELLEQVGRASPIPLSALHTDVRLLPGTRLMDGRFVLGQKLGEGGMGVVYEALDTACDRRVALKFLSRADPASIVRFKREFRSLADVVHPHLLRMHALFRWQNSWFFSMELLHGQSFFVHYEALGDAAARLDLLRRALPQLEAGISALHRLGKLHCDLKPSNVFVSAADHVTILDFGLVVDRALDGAEHTLGTPGYIAPELRAGEAPSPASDWYALGVMLQQALGRVSSYVPSADLRAIAEALVQQRPEARAQGVALLRRLGTPQVEAAALPQLGCVGRREQLAVLQQALRRVRSGQHVVCRISGASGVGKSTLLRAFSNSLDGRDTLVLHGRCFEREWMPFKLLDGVVDALAHALTRRSHHLALAPGASHALALAFPSLGRLLPHAGEGHEPRSAEQQRRQLRDALCQVLHAACAGRMAVLAIDDAQWADPDGAALCAGLLERASPLLLILVERAETGQLEPLARAVEARGGALLNLTLGGLSADEMRELVQRLPGAQHVSPQALVQQTQGSPYLALELLRFLHGRDVTGAPTLEQALRARVAQLPDEARAVLQLVAIAGAPLEARVLARALPGQDSERWSALLCAHSLLRSHTEASEPAHDVYHDRVRSTLLGLLTRDQQRALHGELGGALEALRPAEVERLTLHFEEALQPERAAVYAWRAGRRAAKALAFEQAASFLGKAQRLGSWSRADEATLMRERADALAIVGRAAEAGAQYLHADDLSRQPGQLALLAAGQLLCGGQIEQGLTLLSANLRGSSGPMPTVAQLPGALAHVFAQLVTLLARPVHYGSGRARADLNELEVDACYWAALGLVGSDTEGLGSYLLLRQAVQALELGDPLRIVRALEITAAFGACTRSPLLLGLLGRMVEVSAQAARGLSDPRIPFWRALRQGIQAHWAFDQTAKHHHVEAAQRYADACYGVQRERLILWFFCGFNQFEAGRPAAHFEQAAQVQGEALRHQDRHAQMWSQLSDLRPLLEGDARALETRLAALHALPDRYGDALTGFATYTHEWQLAMTERACQLATRAHTRMAALLKRAARERLLWSVPRHRGLLLSEALACTLACGAASSDPRPWLAEAKGLLAQHPAPDVWLLPYRAGIAALRGERARLHQLLHEISRHEEVEFGFWLTRAARLQLAARGGERAAALRAERELLQAGVKNPNEFAQFVIPGVRLVPNS